MTVLADGTVALCDQDWRGEAALGQVQGSTMHAAWQRVTPLTQLHQAGRWDEIGLCQHCTEWHRP
jgi:hypothetical protein